jgi:hypothetical protein
LKKNLVYVISWKFSENDGVTKKTIEQLIEWSKHFNVLLIWFENSDNKPSFDSSYISNRFKIKVFNVRINPIGYLSVIREVNKFNPDFLYTRYPFFHPLIFILSIIFNPIYEINTLEKKEMQLNYENRKSFSFLVIYKIFKKTRDFYLRRAKAIFFVTEELKNHSDYSVYSNKYFVPNCISINKNIDYKKINTSTEVNLLFIGTKGHSWHGIDKIEQLASLTTNFNYHIVGSNGDSYNNIKYYGVLSKDQIKKLMRSMDMCIGSLSMDVLGLKEACPLKVREYIAAGFPIIIGYKDSAFSKVVPKWVFKLEFEELNINEFIKFCLENKNTIIPFSDKLNYIGIEAHEKIRINVIQNC